LSAPAKGVNQSLSPGGLTVESQGLGGRALYYYALMALAGAFGFSKGVVYAKVLGSTGLGHYAVAVLIATYAEYVCHLGLYPGLECLLPSLYGAGRAREAEDLRNRMAGFMVLLMAVLLTGAVTAAVLIGADHSVARSIVVLSMLLIGSNMLLAVAVQDVRSQRKTIWLGYVMTAKSILTLTAGALAAWAYGYTGALGAEISVNLLLFVVLASLGCENFRFQMDRFDGLRPVMRVGVPLVLKNATNHFSMTFDRWCVISVLGVAAFGQYTFAMLLVSAGLALHNAIWIHRGPQAAFAYGRDGDVETFCRSLHRLAGGVLVGFLLGAVPFIYLVDWIVPRYFAEYQDGGRLLPIVYWGACFQVIAQYEWVAMALKRTGLLLGISLASTAVTTVLYGVGIAFEWSLAGFAWIFVVGRALNAGGQFVSAFAAARAGPSVALSQSSLNHVAPTK
jgi:O-antigen/teichoic acid export membrane protein